MALRFYHGPQILSELTFIGRHMPGYIGKECSCQDGSATQGSNWIQPCLEFTDSDSELVQGSASDTRSVRGTLSSPGRLGQWGSGGTGSYWPCNG